METDKHLSSPVPAKPASPMDDICLAAEIFEFSTSAFKAAKKTWWEGSLGNPQIFYKQLPSLLVLDSSPDLVSALAKSAASWIEGTSSLADIHPLNYPSSERPSDQSTAAKLMFGPRIFSILHLSWWLEALTQKSNHRILHSFV